MIVGIDIDGTITRCPEFFALLSKTLKAEEHTVLIITFRDDPVEIIQAELMQLGIAYTELITKVNIEANEFVTWKAEMCKRRGVDIFFEDMPDVAAAVEPPTVVMLPLNERTQAFMANVPWSEES